MKKFGKENGKLLFEYEKLKLERKDLMERHMTTSNSLEKVRELEPTEPDTVKQEATTRPKLELSKTSFQRYIELKSNRSKMTPKYKTASSTPCHLATPLEQDLIVVTDMH